MTSSTPAEQHLLPVLLPAEKIRQRVNELAREIRRDYEGRKPTVLIILKGAFVFAADLVRAMGIPVEIEFLRAQSYHDATYTSGEVDIIYAPTSLAGKDVLIIEDIVDTGLTLSYVKRRIKEMSASSVKICTLLDKPIRREAALEPDYVGFVIPDVFVVGYGIDYAGQHRELADICAIQE